MKVCFRIFFITSIVFCTQIKAANYYWIGGTGNWNNLAHWAITSGGSTTYTLLPTVNDNVIFDTLSFSGAGQTVTVNIGSAKCRTMDWSKCINNPTFTGTAADTLSVYGSLVFNTVMSNNFLGNIYFLTTSATDSIRTNGISIKGNACFNGSGTYSFKTAFTCLDTIKHFRGTFKTNSKNIFCKIFNASSSFSRVLNLGASVITITGNGLAWDAGSTGLTLTAGNSKIIFTNAANTYVQFNSGGTTKNYNVVNFQCLFVKMITDGTFDSLQVSAGATMVLPNSKTQFLSTLIANGTCGNPIVIKSDGTSVATISKSSASSITSAYLRLSLVSKTGLGTITANNSIIEVAPCTGWVVNPIASATTFYWIGGNGKWSSPLHWSTTSGGAAGTCIPGPSDNVVFNTLSGFAVNDSVIVDNNAYCNNMNWIGALPNPRLSGVSTKLEIKGSVVFVATMTAPFTGDYKFTGTATQTINTAGVVLNGDAYFNGTAGQWQLQSALSSFKKLIVQSGHLNTQNNNVTCFAFVSNAGTGRQLTLGSSVFTVSGYGTGWDVLAPFTLSAGTSEIVCNTATSNLVTFKGAGLTYNNLTLNNYYTSITAANTFKTVKISAGKTLALQSGVTQTLDSLACQGTCSLPITLEASSIFGTPANISKTGDTLVTVNYVYLKNITASATAPNRVYKATNSIAQYTTTGWTVTGSTAGGKRYWIGGTGNWSSSGHWSLTSGGSPTACIPIPADTVIFDANSFSATGQVVNVDVDGYCSVMDWTGANFNPKLFLIRNVIVKRKATLTPVMQVARFSRTPQLQFLPSGNSIDFDSKKVLLNTDVLFFGQNGTDSLRLLNHLYMTDTSAFSMVRGTFITNNDSINAGAMNFLNVFPKTTTLGSSYIDLTFGWNAFTGGTMNLNSGTSTININGYTTYDYFYGDSLTYNNVIIASPSDTNTFVSGSNTFNNLTIKAGVEAKVTAATTQTINGTFTADGTCIDSIKIESTVAGNTVFINQAAGSVTNHCLRLKDVHRTGGATFTTLFSTNLGNVTGWTFTPTPPTTANFTTNNNICLGTISTFTNTSTSYLGGAFTNQWNFGDGATDNILNPTHTYTISGKKYVTLTTFFPASSCSNTHLDSIFVNSPSVSLSCSEPDSTICAGTQIEFDAVGQPGSLFQFLVDGTPQGGFSSVDSLLISTLTNGQIVSANVSLNGCTGSSLQAIPITVNPSPTVILNSTDGNDSICVGTSVTFTASGAHKYQFFVNGIAQSLVTTNNVFTTSSLTNGQIVSVTGYDTVSGCSRTALPHTMFVSAYPTPTMTCSTPNLICDGTSVTFTGANAGLFEFFVNGVSQGVPSTVTTFTTSTLTNAAIVTVKGTTYGCTSQSTNSFVFTVNPIPAVNVTNTSTANTICASQPITFTATGANQYQFFVNGASQGAPSGNNSLTTSTLTNGQTITVNGTSNSCVGTSAGTTITVNPLPTVTLSSSDADNIICLNQSVTFTAHGAATYEFFINGISQGAPSASSVFTTTSITNSQTVNVKGYTALGCSANGNNSFTFTVLPAPTINFYTSDADNIICSGQSVSFTSLGGNTYQFFVNGNSQGAASAVNTFATSLLPVGTPTITVVGTSNNGCSAQSNTVFTFTVNPIPAIVLSSSDADNIICNGTTVNYLASGASLYQFFINGVSQGPLSVVDTFLTSNLINGQVVTVNGSQNGCSSTGTPALTMTVNPIPTVAFSSSDLDNIICEGQQVTYTASGASTYEYFINGISQGTPTASTTFVPSTLINNDSISVIGSTGGCSSAGTSDFTMSVYPLPVVSFTSSDADTIICRNESVSFTASGANLYEFFINGVSQGAASTNATFTTTSILNGRTVTCIGTNNYGCSQLSANAYTFVVHPLPNVTFTTSDADHKICTNESVTFTANGANLYQFFVNGVPQDTLSFINTFSTTTLSNLQSVTVQGSTNGCTDAANNSITFNVYTFPTVNLATSAPSGIICAGQTVTFTGSGANQYQYFIDGIPQGAPTASSTFTTTAITNGQTVSANGINVVCPSPSSQTYIYSVVNYPIVAVTANSSNTICYGTPVTFTATGATTYEFFINGISQGTASATNTFTSATIENSDVVTVKGYNGNCDALSTNTFTFTVNKMNLDISSSPANLVCQSSPITFTASGANLYQFFVNGTSQGAPSASNTFTSSSLTNGSVVTFTGTNTSTSCVQSCEFQQYVNVMATPHITASSATTFCEGDSVLLQSNYSVGNQWLLGGSDVANANDDTYYAKTSGAYSINVSQGGNGTIWSVGDNVNGQLGDSTLNSSLTQKIVKNITGITDIDAGNEFNIALNSSGNVFVWGNNAVGSLGDGTFTDRNFPYQLPSIANAIAVAAGAENSLVVLPGGAVQSFGNNTDGQLGIGNNGIANFPTTVAGLTGITAVSGGEKHSLALKSDGTVWAWGDNLYGQLGDGTFTDRNIPVQVTGLSNVIAISAGKYHSMALKSDSTIWVWGNNAQGELGTNSVTYTNTAMQVPLFGKFISVSAGNDFSLALNKNGKVYSWGDNQFGQLGDGTVISRYNPLPISNFNGVKKIKAGANHSMASKQDLSLWAWGNNVSGQLGDGTFVNSSVPLHITALSGAGQVALGLNHTCVAMANEATCVSNTLNISVSPAPAVSIYDHVTYLSTDAGVSYQWYYNSSPILNGTNQNQNLLGVGHYFVQVTYANGCTTTSSDFGYMLGVADLLNNNNIQLYPNPTNENLTITYAGNAEINEIYLTDIIGKRILNIANNITSKHYETKITLNSFNNGVYIVCVKSKTGMVAVKRVVVEN